MADLDMIQTHVDILDISCIVGGEQKSTISTFYALGKSEKKKRHDGFIRHNKKKRWRQVRFLAPFFFKSDLIHSADDERESFTVDNSRKKLLYVGREIPAGLKKCLYRSEKDK